MKILNENLVTRGREEFSSLFGFQRQVSIVSYVPRKDKCVILLSTMHHDAGLCNQPHHKPDIIMDYNKTKGYFYLFFVS